MAMTFTLISHLREQLTLVLQARAERIQKAEQEKERRIIEVSRMVCPGSPSNLIRMHSIGGGSAYKRHACDTSIIPQVESCIHCGAGREEEERGR